MDERFPLEQENFIFENDLRLVYVGNTTSPRNGEFTPRAMSIRRSLKARGRFPVVDVFVDEYQPETEMKMALGIPIKPDLAKQLRIWPTSKWVLTTNEWFTDVLGVICGRRDFGQHHNTIARFHRRLSNLIRAADGVLFLTDNGTISFRLG